MIHERLTLEDWIGDRFVSATIEVTPRTADDMGSVDVLRLIIDGEDAPVVGNDEVIDWLLSMNQI